jgi:hypothetical protein
MAILLSLQSKVTRNEEKLSAIREQNPHINAMAYGSSGMFGAKGSISSASEGCRLAIPDTALLLRDADGPSLAGLKPYVPAAPLVLVPPPPVPAEKAGGAGDKGAAGRPRARASLRGGRGAETAQRQILTANQ